MRDSETKKHKEDVNQSKYVRLRGRFSDNTGIVEVKPNGSALWGAVCGDRFTEQDARVVCREILHIYHVYPTRRIISDPDSYDYYRPTWYSQLGCKHESASLQSCKVPKVDILSTFICSNTQSWAAVCCKTSTEPGVYSEDRTLYTTHCPYTWVEAKNRICITGYSNIKYNDSRLIHVFNTSWLWTSSRMKIFEMNVSLCDGKFSGILEKDNFRNCSSIYQYCLRKERQYYMKQGDNCFCLKDDEICHKITSNMCPENCTDVTNSTCPENCTSDEGKQFSGLKIFRIVITEDDDSNSSTCIQVRFKNGMRFYNIEDCGMLQQTVCVKSDICSSQPCVNGGICKPNNDGKSFNCKCVLNYIGTNCDTDACIPYPCNGTFEYCKANKDRTNYTCESINFTTSTTRYSTKQQSSEADEDRTVIIIIVIVIVLLVVIAVIFLSFYIFRRSRRRRRKGDSCRPNSMANQTYGVHIREDQEVYDLIDDAKLDPTSQTPLSRRKPVEVIALDDYTMPSDALVDTAEYAETYDEAKLIKYQREQEMKDKINDEEKEIRNKNAYFILEKEETGCKYGASEGDDNEDPSHVANKEELRDKIRRVSSYEDTDNCIQKAKQSKISDDSGYEITSAVGKGLDLPPPVAPESNNLFAKGLDHIPESIQRKLGIRFVSGDYSEYYAYKLLRRNTTDSRHCENKDLCERTYESFGNLPKSNAHTDIANAENNDTVNEYDKLHYYTRTKSKQQNRYDRVLGNFDKHATSGNKDMGSASAGKKRHNSV